MIRKAACIVLLGFVLVVTVLLSNVSVLAQPQTWIVDDDGVADFGKIQDAINAAASGDSIHVRSGMYYEHVIVNKSVALIGESRETTVVDALGVGTAFTVDSDNVNVTGFTVMNAGKTWSISVNQSYPDSCVFADSVHNVNIEGNLLTGATVGAWISNSSYVSIVDNVVAVSVYAGIVGYGSSNISIQQNTVRNCESMGILLDAGTIYSDISDNILTTNMEGLRLKAGSNANRIERNVFSTNGVSIVLNNAGSELVPSRNTFRNNDMSGNLQNLIVWGSSIDSFMQDIDSSNLVDGRKVYYLINLHDQAVNFLNHANPGYLALINSTNISLSGLSLLGNGDGMLLAYCENCALANLTISRNQGPQVWGGLTLYESHGNNVTSSCFSNNSYGVALCNSDWNLLYTNLFVDNERQVITDFAGPFSRESSGYYSRNRWDDGSHGNYWSDYLGVDADNDGVGDTDYVIGVNNVDYHPLILADVETDLAAPMILIYSPRELTSPGYIVRASSFTIVWDSWDAESGVAYYEIRLDGGVWTNVSFTNTYQTFAEATFADLSDGLHTVDIRAVDSAGNVRQERYEFTVDTLFSRVAPVAVLTVALSATSAVLFFLTRRFFPRRSKVARRLVR